MMKEETDKSKKASLLKMFMSFNEINGANVHVVTDMINADDDLDVDDILSMFLVTLE